MLYMKLAIAFAALATWESAVSNEMRALARPSAPDACRGMLRRPAGKFATAFTSSQPGRRRGADQDRRGFTALLQRSRVPAERTHDCPLRIPRAHLTALDEEQDSSLAAVARMPPVSLRRGVLSCSHCSPAGTPAWATRKASPQTQCFQLYFYENPQP